MALPSNEPAYIRVSSLRKTYQMGQQAVHALDGVDMEVAGQSFCVIMGPSGSGKSTLLYLLGGLDRPTSGRIEVGSQSIETLDENQLAVFRRKTVGFVFQSFNLIASMKAWENVSFPMQFAGVSRREQRRRSLELLERVGLLDRADHRPNELSGGQQQRVAIARALVNDPALILADEPTGNLDSGSGYSIMQVLSELHLSGRTVVVVTHDPRMIRFSTNRFYLLDGKIVDEATYRQATLAQEAMV
jgi:putative ABC transport system ATP-binding protein